MEPEDETARIAAEAARFHRLLVDIVDSGRPHSHLCECEHCLAWDAVRKELRGE